mgnify:CR=1 FL=1
MPEIACPQQLEEGLKWKHIRPRQHVCLYSDSAAQKLFAQCGWKVEALHRPLRIRAQVRSWLEDHKSEAPVLQGPDAIRDEDEIIAAVSPLPLLEPDRDRAPLPRPPRERWPVASPEPRLTLGRALEGRRDVTG